MQFIDAETVAHISPSDLAWLEKVFKRFSGFPTLEQLWLLMDEIWDSFACDASVMDERVSAFYFHPIWLLNGLFIEQHEPSLSNRRTFANWVVQQAPNRIADYGGGFGSLARMIAGACPEASVEVIEPHPHPAAIARAEATTNVRYQPRLTGHYDVLIATDVFEHVPDPLGLVAATAPYLGCGGRYLIANSFYPQIKCHLPQTFHFRHSWDVALTALGLRPGDAVCYGRAFAVEGACKLASARRIEARSRFWFHWISRLPGPVAHRVSQLLWKRIE